MTILFEIINKEYEILKEMLKYCEEQNQALVRFHIPSIEKATSKIAEYSKQAKELEEKRISILMKELNLSRKEVYKLKLSDLAKKIDIPKDLYEKREEILRTIEKLAGLNSLNKLLANRGLGTINDILMTFSNSSKSVCDVKI
ncbi:MAG: flagellar protein FlgN [Ignavibacteria bacterium]|nr:flagellar protein FlgN [Ignavibacteria bacterium]